MVDRILKMLCVIFSCAAVMLCGCNKNATETETVQTDFKAEFTADYEGLALKGALTNTRQGITNLRFSAPDTLDGLCLDYKGGELSIARGSIKCTADEAYLPDSSFPSVLREFFLNIALGNFTLERDHTYSMRLGGENCLFTVDEGGIPVSMSIPDSETEVCFSNAEKIG